VKLIRQTLNCCNNEPIFKIIYVTDSQYFVCAECIKIPHWSRGIKSKKVVGTSLETEPTSKNTSDKQRYSK